MGLPPAAAPLDLLDHDSFGFEGWIEQTMIGNSCLNSRLLVDFTEKKGFEEALDEKERLE